jgi:hypothetical protein
MHFIIQRMTRICALRVHAATPPADPARPGDLNTPGMDMISSKLCVSLSLKAGIEILFLQNLAAHPGALEAIAFKA